MSEIVNPFEVLQSDMLFLTAVVVVLLTFVFVYDVYTKVKIMNAIERVESEINEKYEGISDKINRKN